MSLVWHIVKKDFRRMWIPLGLWALVLLAKDRVGVLTLAHDGIDLDRWTRLGFFNGLWLGLDILVNVILVAVLVHEDALVGSRMGWATRPISGGRLLAAKLINLALMFGALPVLVAVPWWLANDYGAREIARAVWITLDWQALVVLPALLLAVLTETPLRFLGWLLGLGAAVAVIAVTAPLFSTTDTNFGVEAGTLTTRHLIIVSAMLVCGMSVIGWQFFTRRLPRAVAALAVMIGVMRLVDTCWPWNIVGAWPPSRIVTPAAGVGAVSVEAGKVKLYSAPIADGYRWVTVDCVLRGVPEEFGVRGAAENLWRWTDGDVARKYGGVRTAWPAPAEWLALGLPPEKNSAAAQAWLHAGREQPEDWSVDGGARVQVQSYLTTADVQRLADGAPAYSGKLLFQLEKPEREFELPLRAGEKFSSAGGSVRIAVVDWREGELSVTLITSEAQLDNYGRSRPGIFSVLHDFLGWTSDGPRGFSLVNRARGEAVKLWPYGQTVGFPVSTQHIGWMTLRCKVPHDPDEPTGRPPRWLEGATLAGVREHEVGSVVREVKFDHFKMEETKEPLR